MGAAGGAVGRRAAGGDVWRVHHFGGRPQRPRAPQEDVCDVCGQRVSGAPASSRP